MSKAKLDWSLFEKAAAAVKQAGGAIKDPVTGETHGLFAPGFTPPIPDWDDAREPPRGDGLFGDAEAPEESVLSVPDLTPDQWRNIYSRIRKPVGRDRHGETSPSLGWQGPQALDRLHFRRPSPPPGWGDSGRSQMFNPQKPLPPGYPGSLNFGK